MDVWYIHSENKKFKVIQRSKCLVFIDFSAIFRHFDLHLTLTFLLRYFLSIFLSLADDLSVILYQNNEVTSTSNPTIHIHIKKTLWKQLIRFPAFSFFESHHFFSEVSPDNKVTHARCSKPSEIVQNQILVFVLTISKIVWSVLNQMFTLLHLFLPENHCFFKNSRKNSKNLQKTKPFKIYRRKWF